MYCLRYGSRLGLQRITCLRLGPSFSSSSHGTHNALEATEISLRMLRLIQAFRFRGHFAANLDPLAEPSRRMGIERKISWLPDDPDLYPDTVKLLKNFPVLDLRPFKLESVDPDTPYFIGDELYLAPHDEAATPEHQTRFYYSINELVHMLRRTYCSNVGVEVIHIENMTHQRWLLQQFGAYYGPRSWSVSESKKDKLRIFKNLLECDHTSTFFGLKFPSAKVFGIEGCESLLPGLWSVLETSSQLGVEGIELGMAHRGRMNILVRHICIFLSTTVYIVRINKYYYVA